MEMVNSRNYFYDNAKFILIFLVVLGHMLEPFVGVHTVISGIFGFIYMFHMPAFIFISGYYTKKDITKKVIFRLFLDYFVMFVLVQLLFVIFTRMLGIQQYKIITITPAYIYWYLFAVFIWNIVLKVAILVLEHLRIKIEYLIAMSFLLGLVVGYFDFVSWRLSLSRIIVFFPFFILGYYFKTNNKKICDVIHSKIIAVIIMALGLGAAFLFDNIFKFSLLSCAISYHSIGLDKYAMIYRIIIYLAQLLMIISFFSLIPNKENHTTSIGRKTFNIYILHGFVIKLMVALSYFDKISLVKVLILPLFTILIVCIFGKMPINLQLSKIKYSIQDRNKTKNSI